MIPLCVYPSYVCRALLSIVLPSFFQTSFILLFFTNRKENGKARRKREIENFIFSSDADFSHFLWFSLFLLLFNRKDHRQSIFIPLRTFLLLYFYLFYELCYGRTTNSFVRQMLTIFSSTHSSIDNAQVFTSLCQPVSTILLQSFSSLLFIKFYGNLSWF